MYVYIQTYTYIHKRCDSPSFHCSLRLTHPCRGQWQVAVEQFGREPAHRSSVRPAPAASPDLLVLGQDQEFTVVNILMELVGGASIACLLHEMGAFPEEVRSPARVVHQGPDFPFFSLSC